MLQFLLSLNTDLLTLFEEHALFQEKYIYIAETAHMIQEMITAINTNNEPESLTELKYKYMQIVREILKHHRWSLNLSAAKVILNQDICYGCLSSDNFILEDDNLYCTRCNLFQCFGKTRLTSRDFSRVNIVSKFVYSRITHFKDCMKQYQGRQNAFIPNEILLNLDKKFAAYKLIDVAASGPDRYKKITKAHIIAFLRELKYSRHYENTNLIFFKLKGEYFDSIKHLEGKLLKRFKQLVDVYDEMKPQNNRKNFMNIQYILFQLLRSLDHPCALDDFTFLKTSDRKRHHDNICRKIFNKLGWKFTNI